MLGGIILCLAASPPVAARIGLDPFHFVNRQVFPAPAAVVTRTSVLVLRHVTSSLLVRLPDQLGLIAASPPFDHRGAGRWLAILRHEASASRISQACFWF